MIEKIKEGNIKDLNDAYQMVNENLINEIIDNESER